MTIDVKKIIKRPKGMDIDAKKIIKKLKGDTPKRGPVNVYLDLELFDKFKESCGEVTPSRVFEELMRSFIESANLKK